MGITVGKSYDLNAAEFFNATQTLTPIQKQAVNDLVKDLKNYNIWDKMKAVYPFVGQAGVSSSFQFNLKNPNTFKGIFSGSWIFSSTGATPDGVSAYMDTGLNALSVLQTDSTHMSNYLPNLTNDSEINASQMGAYGNGTGTYMFWKYDGTTKIAGRLSANTNTFQNTTIIGESGFNLVTRTSNVFSKIYINNSKFETSTNASYAQGDFTFYIGARNNNGSAYNFSATKQSFASIGDGLTDTQAANFYTAVQRFQTTLGRQV